MPSGMANAGRTEDSTPMFATTIQPDRSGRAVRRGGASITPGSDDAPPIVDRNVPSPSYPGPNLPSLSAPEPGLSFPCPECFVVPALRLPRAVGFAYDVYQASWALAKAPPQAPNFVVSPDGTAYPVPASAQCPDLLLTRRKPDRRRLHRGRRLMDPTPPRGDSPRYPDG